MTNVVHTEFHLLSWVNIYWRGISALVVLVSWRSRFGTRLLGLIFSKGCFVVKGTGFSQVLEVVEHGGELLVLFSIESLDRSFIQGPIVVRVPLGTFSDTNVVPMLGAALGHMIARQDGSGRRTLVIIETIILIVTILVLLVLPPVLFVESTVANLVQRTHRWAARWVISHFYRA